MSRSPDAVCRSNQSAPPLPMRQRCAIDGPWLRRIVVLCTSGHNSSLCGCARRLALEILAGELAAAGLITLGLRATAAAEESKVSDARCRAGSSNCTLATLHRPCCTAPVRSARCALAVASSASRAALRCGGALVCVRIGPSQPRALHPVCCVRSVQLTASLDMTDCCGE